MIHSLALLHISLEPLPNAETTSTDILRQPITCN
jgi:hypothetical protein